MDAFVFIARRYWCYCWRFPVIIQMCCSTSHPEREEESVSSESRRRQRWQQRRPWQVVPRLCYHSWLRRWRRQSWRFQLLGHRHLFSGRRLPWEYSVDETESYLQRVGDGAPMYIPFSQNVVREHSGGQGSDGVVPSVSSGRGGPDTLSFGFDLIDRNITKNLLTGKQLTTPEQRQSPWRSSPKLKPWITAVLQKNPSETPPLAKKGQRELHRVSLGLYRALVIFWEQDIDTRAGARRPAGFVIYTSYTLSCCCWVIWAFQRSFKQEVGDHMYDSTMRY